MNAKNSLKLALGTTFAAGIVLSTASALADNPFSASVLNGGYMQLAEADKAGEAKCGANKETSKDGNCGAKKEASKDGNCGANMKCPADTNEDGMVTKEEFMTYHEKMFDEADANKDGSLDADERKALHSKMMDGKCGAKKEGSCGGNKSEDAKPEDTKS